MFNHLQKYGWNADLESTFQNSVNEKNELIPARVLSVHRTNYELITESGEIVAEITGNRLKDVDVYSKPIVGDWVAVSLGARDNANIIEEILPRRTILERRRAHSDTEVQIMATNVDTAVIVQSLAQDFNVNRLERVLTQLTDTNIKPLIVLNKVDLIDNIFKIHEDMESISSNVPVIYSSFETGEGLSDIHNFLKPGETVVFIGSSGVGKSSIINTMLDEERQQLTGEVSDWSGKGKHTTTARKLFLLDNDVIVIDTPGTREFGLTVGDEVLNQNFEIIENLALQCKFRNCNHDKEPECAVKNALESGELQQELFNNYKKLQEEIKK
ncbi:MAG: ribosome small subunit-dependent GTPase A [Candidatus Pacebacteria bacterium]|nr:ribosome small subunit-dependent GTPase A [Candidatus Paceibacterota bacterium]